jgi:hypothetical protein
MEECRKESKDGEDVYLRDKEQLGGMEVVPVSKFMC